MSVKFGMKFTTSTNNSIIQPIFQINKSIQLNQKSEQKSTAKVIQPNAFMLYSSPQQISFLNKTSGKKSSKYDCGCR